jgi:hypothetical protein
MLARNAWARQVGVDLGADLWQCCTELAHPTVLGFVTHGMPAWVIAILLAAARVASGGLQVPLGR